MTTGSDLSGRTAAVVGGAGGVGEGITRALLDAGAHVIAVGRSKSRLDDLASRVGGKANLDALVVDLASDDPAAVTRSTLERFGALDLVVLAVGDPGQSIPTDILDLSDENFLSMVGANELIGLRALRAFVPATAADGSVVGLVGFSSEVPFPQRPLMGVTNAAMRSLLSSLAEQRADAGPRVHTVVLGVVRTRARQQAGVDNPAWLDGEDVGRRAIELHLTQETSATSYLLDPGTARVRERTA